jgi:3-oxoacyl-[acyl-carrier protein] reductase
MHNVIVTGGSRGIGLAIATALAEAGHRVHVIARAPTEQLEAAVSQAAGSGRGALLFHSFDLTKTAELGGLVSGLRKEHGHIYGLVNNAGLGTPGMLAMMREADIQRLLQLNVTVPLLLSKHVLQSMMVQREGRIVNIASVVALTGYSGLSAYSASKAALVGFTRSLAREVGQLGVTVNAVAPGFIETDMTKAMDEEQREQIKRRSALKRLAEPRDVAAAVSFLMGEGARNITGTVMTVDAGNTI